MPKYNNARLTIDTSPIFASLVNTLFYFLYVYVKFILTINIFTFFPSLKAMMKASLKSFAIVRRIFGSNRNLSSRHTCTCKYPSQ